MYVYYLGKHANTQTRLHSHVQTHTHMLTLFIILK